MESSKRDIREYCPGVGRACRLPEKCCLSGTVCCVPTSYTLTNEHLDKTGYIDDDIRFSVINLWYFWFAVVFFVTICTGVCAFVRRQHRLFLLATERSAVARSMANTTVHLSAEASGYRHNYHPASCTLRPPFYRRQRPILSTGVVGRQLYFATVLSVSPPDIDSHEIHGEFQDPPSYSEVVGKSDSIPTPDYFLDLPTYDEASRALQRQQQQQRQQQTDNSGYMQLCTESEPLNHSSCSTSGAAIDLQDDDH